MAKKKDKIDHPKKDSEEFKRQVNAVYELIKQGMRSNEIFANMLVDHEDMNEYFFKVLLEEAYRLAEAGLHKDREYTFQLHMERYEKMYEESMKMFNSWNQPLDPKKDWNIILKKYISAMRALEAKEHLIGLHDKSMVIEFNDQKATVIEKEELRGNPLPGIQLDNLTLAEQIELLDYIREARTIPMEGIQRVVVKQTKIEINMTDGTRTVGTDVKKIDDVESHIQDIEFEEMPEDVVSRFQKIPDKEPPIEEVGPGSVHVEDLTDGKTNSGKSGDDVIQKVKMSALDQLRKKLGK
jgi:hypothetical protein